MRWNVIRSGGGGSREKGFSPSAAPAFGSGRRRAASRALANSVLSFVTVGLLITIPHSSRRNLPLRCSALSLARLPALARSPGPGETPMARLAPVDAQHPTDPPPNLLSLRYAPRERGGGRERAAVRVLARREFHLRSSAHAKHFPSPGRLASSLSLSLSPFFSVCLFYAFRMLRCVRFRLRGIVIIFFSGRCTYVLLGSFW